MRQTTLCVPLEVKPESASRLSALIEQLKAQEDTGLAGLQTNFGRVIRDIPVLHFMSISVFTSPNYDPTFILEANFDGPPGVFWGQFEAAFAAWSRDVLRCCKVPLDDDADLYNAVTAAGSTAPVAPYFEARTHWPSVFHHGNRGMTRDRILAEAALFVAVRDELDDPNRSDSNNPEPSPYRATQPAQVHQRLRAKLLPAYAWLDQPAPERIPAVQRAADLIRFVLFVVVLLFILTLPGVIFAAIAPAMIYLTVTILLALGILGGIFTLRKPLPGTGITTQFDLLAFLIKQAPYIAGYVLVATLLVLPVDLAFRALFAWMGYGVPHTFWIALWRVTRAVLMGLFSLIVVGPLIILWLRYLERRDSAQDAPPIEDLVLRDMARTEDWIAQNHMGSIVLIKPGILRTAIIRAGHLGLGLLLRLTATDGYLGSMRTVHFAHWAFLNNGSRLLFFSNFDQSWGAYLDDFIEKAHVGLTLAWGTGVGFPTTRFLLFDGASHGRQFKNWALASRAVSRFWYSAYPDLTVNQIERNNRIADGLHRAQLTDTEAALWIKDL